MDIDLSVLSSLESEKDISMDLAIKAIEDALLVAYHKTERRRRDRAGRGQPEQRPRDRVGDGDRRGRASPARVRRHARRFRPDRRHHRPAGHPAAAARRRGRADVRRVRRARGRHRGRRHPAGQGPARGARRPGQAGGDPAAHRAGARRAVRARRAAALLRAARAQGLPRALGDAVPDPSQPGQEAVRDGGAGDRRRARSRSPRSRARPVTAPRSR